MNDVKKLAEFDAIIDSPGASYQDKITAFNALVEEQLSNIDRAITDLQLITNPEIHQQTMSKVDEIIKTIKS